MFTETRTDLACSDCGFALWIPVAETKHSRVGIYNDGRFPGRSIVSLKQHFDQLEEVPQKSMDEFMRDIRQAAAAIRSTTGAARINVSILGNRDPHVHAHLIPRYPDREEYPTDAPWRDPREAQKLSSEEVDELRAALLLRLTSPRFAKSSRGRRPTPVPMNWPRLFTDRELQVAD